jgi:hypothetical protein
MSRFLALLALLAACTGTTADDTGKAAGDDSAADTDTDTDAACTTLTGGDDWVWNGECPQMRTPCDIVVNECALEIDYGADGGMTMGMPYAATIAGDTITFADGDTVTGCVGTIEDADTVSGSCDGGCTFTLAR